SAGRGGRWPVGDHPRVRAAVRPEPGQSRVVPPGAAPDRDDRGPAPSRLAARRRRAGRRRPTPGSGADGPGRRHTGRGIGGRRMTYLVGKIALEVVAGAPNNGRGESNRAMVKTLRV